MWLRNLLEGVMARFLPAPTPPKERFIRSVTVMSRRTAFNPVPEAEVLDKLKAHLKELGIPEKDVLNVDHRIHVHERELHNDYTRTASATFWTEDPNTPSIIRT